MVVMLLMTEDSVFAASPPPPPYIACEAAQLKAAGDKADCLAQEESKALLGKPSNPATCEDTFAKAFAKAEAAAIKKGGFCLTMGSGVGIGQRIEAAYALIARAVRDGGRFRSNGDGTIIDFCTGLMWELKDNSGGLHDNANTYDWYTATGTWIDGVNAEGGTGFAGYNDWRMPTVNELVTIMNYRNVDIEFIFGPSRGPHWSSLQTDSSSFNAWYFDFHDGVADTNSPDSFYFVRAVRGGY